jgi:hypothetical protein
VDWVRAVMLKPIQVLVTLYAYIISDVLLLLPANDF